MNDTDYNDLLDSAREFNKVCDKTEIELGLPTPIQIGIVECLKTAMQAIEAGLKTEDPNAVAQAYVLLEDVLKVLEDVNGINNY